MTGGVGFSRTGKQSFDDNHQLGKIREKRIWWRSGKNEILSDPKSLEDAINFSNLNREHWTKLRAKIYLGILLTVVILLTIFILRG